MEQGSTKSAGQTVLEPSEWLTFVLVHGAFHGGWCWAQVAEGLRHLGHRVHTPTLTGLGERSHLLSCKPTLETWIEDIAQVLRFEDLFDVILVGHSFSGSIVSALADRMPDRLRRIVYLDAMILQSGQAPFDIMPPGRIDTYQKLACDHDGISVPPNSPEYYGITDPEKQEWYRTKLTPHPVQTYLDRLELNHPLGNGLPATYVACVKPFFPAMQKSRHLAQSMLGWTYLEIPTVHNAMAVDPTMLTELLADVEARTSMLPTDGNE